MDSLLIGLETLEAEVALWRDSVDPWGGAHYFNAKRALAEFRALYADRLAVLARYPFFSQAE